MPVGVSLNLKYTEHIATTNIKWQMHAKIALRLFHRFERNTSRDWHYDGLQPLLGRNLYLATVPQNYDAHVFGVFVQYRLH